MNTKNLLKTLKNLSNSEFNEKFISFLDTNKLTLNDKYILFKIYIKRYNTGKGRYSLSNNFLLNSIENFNSIIEEGRSKEDTGYLLNSYFDIEYFIKILIENKYKFELTMNEFNSKKNTDIFYKKLINPLKRKGLIFVYYDEYPKKYFNRDSFYYLTFKKRLTLKLINDINTYYNKYFISFIINLYGEEAITIDINFSTY